MKLYYFKSCEKFAEKQKIQSLFLVCKDDICQSVNILGEKVKIHA